MNLFRLALDLELTAVLKAVALHIRAGSIEYIRPGSAELKAALKYRGHSVLPEWSVAKLDFPPRNRTLGSPT